MGFVFLMLGVLFTYIFLNHRFRDQQTALKAANAALEERSGALITAKEDAAAAHNQRQEELDTEIKELRQQKELLTRQVHAFEQTEAQRQRDYDQKIERLNLAFEQREQEQEKERLKKEADEKARQKQLNDTWLLHETAIEEQMTLICQRHGIEYVSKEQFPQKGKPDNVVKIADEYVIFDSKSPAGEALNAFPRYINQQAEAAKKYAKYEGVKNDIFLVVPTNAIHVIKEKYRVHGGYRVHVITEDALEPILIGLKKIEAYEFVDRLSPEDREAIATTIGKMAHGIKRRIQVDQFFAGHFLNILTDAEHLPQDILTAAQTVERSNKLNPPQERRTKSQDDSKLLAAASHKLSGKATGHDIDLTPPLMDVIESVPLHRDPRKKN